MKSEALKEGRIDFMRLNVNTTFTHKICFSVERVCVCVKEQKGSTKNNNMNDTGQA